MRIIPINLVIPGGFEMKWEIILFSERFGGLPDKRRFDQIRNDILKNHSPEAAGHGLIPSPTRCPHARNLIPATSKCTTQMTPPTNKTIITVVGKDTVGIIARVCTYLADNQVNIEDISQTIVQSYFTMMMIADTNRSQKPFGEMVRELEALGDEIGVKILCQREDIFTKMHRI